MLTALVLIGSVAITPDRRDCTRKNATAVMRVPARFRNPLHACCTDRRLGWSGDRTSTPDGVEGATINEVIQKL